MDEKPKRKGGFASMSPERRREIARMGGLSVPAEKRSFRKDSELAKVAGKAGGLAVPDERRAFSVNRALASAAGRKGGAAAKQRRSKDSE